MDTVAKLARREGVSEATIKAALRGPNGLAPALELVSRFAEAVVNDQPEASDMRREVSQRFGEAALVDLAFGIIVAQAFPILKRTLGRDAELVPQPTSSTTEVDFARRLT
jgi:hypothetical protein